MQFCYEYFRHKILGIIRLQGTVFYVVKVIKITKISVYYCLYFILLNHSCRNKP